MTALLAAINAPAAATKLDLSADVELKAANYSDLIYGSARNSQGLFTENTRLGFVIKDIRLEKAPQSTMEVGIILQSVGGGTSTAAVTAPQFAEAAARLPATIMVGTLVLPPGTRGMTEASTTRNPAIP